MQSRRGGGPHPPAVDLRSDRRADVGIGPYVVQERNDTRRTVGAGLVPARVSLAHAAEEKEDAHAGGVRVLLV